MAVDSWLSMVGCTAEISNGPADLLGETPKLVQFVMDDFARDFWDLRLSVEDGGLQLISDVTKNVLDMLEDRQLSEAGQIYCLVALLRAIKVARSIIYGVHTALLQDIIMNDAQVSFI
jgi:hypothetical protein